MKTRLETHRILEFSSAILIGSSIGLFQTGCAPMGHLTTPSGRPEITIPRSSLKKATVAIASYNFSKGRQLDEAKANELVTYDAVATPDGSEEVTDKFVYDLIPKADSIVIMSHRVPTEDLDDDDDEDNAQPSFDAQQEELLQIEKQIQMK